MAGKLAIVTGSGRGIGRAIALGYARAGARLVLAARTGAEIEETARQIRAAGGEALPVPTDVQEPDQVARLLVEAERVGKVDILVNNAGANLFATVREMGFDTWDSLLRLNLSSVFICMRIIGEAMVRQKSGTIINMTSLAGLAPLPRSAPYAAAKAGVISLTRTAAVEWAPFNVRVNAIAPGIILTELSRQLAPPTSPYRQAQLRSIPLGRFGCPEDIVGTAVFLASDRAAYITGQTIRVDGAITTTVFPAKL